MLLFCCYYLDQLLVVVDFVIVVLIVVALCRDNFLHLIACKDNMVNSESFPLKKNVYCKSPPLCIRDYFHSGSIGTFYCESNLQFIYMFLRGIVRGNN